MKGIQINNFFNNHISLNGKKNISKQPNMFPQSQHPEPIVFSNHPNEQQPESMTSYDALSPQMKVFNKQPALSGRKKRINTIDPVVKQNQKKKSKGKKSYSYQKLRKAVSLDKYNGQKDTSEQHDVSKALSKQHKKPKTSRNKNQHSEGVKRSKSAILKNTHSKPIEQKQPSTQFLKKHKKNIISADSSFKDAAKRQIKKQTQQLLNKKQFTDKFECKTARVQSTKIKSRKNKDKIIAEINKSTEKDDKKSLKFQTQTKMTGPSASKSYLTSAKQSKPLSARQKKPSKKLFDTNEKNYIKNDEQSFTYQNIGDMIKQSIKNENSQVKQALSQLQQVLQGISSNKELAKELKKLALKLKNVSSKTNSQDDCSSLSEEEQSNSQAFKRIKDFKNKLVKKKLNEPKQVKNIQEPQSHKQQHISSKKSSKKLLKPKKKVEDIQKLYKDTTNKQGLQPNQGQMIQKFSPQNYTSQPQFFKNTEEQQSKYIVSRNVSQFHELGLKQQNTEKPKPVKFEQEQEQEEQILDSNNKKYMEFLKNLQAESQQEHLNAGIKDQISDDNQKSDNLIDDINTYLNREYVQISKEYNTEKPKNSILQQELDKNPLLERRRWDGYPAENRDQDKILKDYLSDNQNESNIQPDNCQDNSAEIHNTNKFSQIEELKSFQKQSDDLMNRVGITKLEQKKKNLTIQLNQQSIVINQQIKTPLVKTPLSPKYDDRYPHMIKSPKFSDIEITNILAAKEKCLVSKHKKMSQLVQRMYEKQLVSPKSYEYYVYQLKKQFDQESQGLDGFKQQASEILNEIKQEKNDIKVIDELLREQKWQQARILMKSDQKAVSRFFCFKKNRDKIYEAYNDQPNTEQNKKEPVQTSPSKKHNIGVIQKNINITIVPSFFGNQKDRIKQAQTIQSQNDYKPAKQNIVKGRQVQKKRNIFDSASLQENSQQEDSITQKLDFQFEQKYKLKSNLDEDDIKTSLYSKDKIQSDFNTYQQDFENYVYYQSLQNDEALVSQLSRQEKAQSNQKNSQRLRPEGIIKLVQVSQEHFQQDNKKSFNDSEDQDFNKQVIKTQTQQQVIQIDQQEPKCSTQDLSQKLIHVPKIQENKKQLDQSEDDVSDDGSILELQLRKGFESNLFFIKEYCISLCQYIRDNSQLKNQFKKNITQPLQFDTVQLLKKYRKSVDGIYNSQFNSTLFLLDYKQDFRKPQKKAISLELAQQFNKTYGPLKFWNKDLSKKGREKFNMQKEAQKTFLSAILQVLNQSLDFERPGSIFGKPLAWANNSKHLKNMKYLHGEKTKKVCQDSQESAQTYDFIFGVAIARIIQWGSCLCGFLPDTAELQNTQIDDDYVVHIRQTRMAFLLQKMLAEEQATFNNSQLQETQVMLYLGKAIAQQLVKEVAEQISLIFEYSFNQI